TQTAPPSSPRSRKLPQNASRTGTNVRSQLPSTATGGVAALSLSGCAMDAFSLTPPAIPALRRRVPTLQPHSFPGRWVGEAVGGRGYGGGTSGRSMNDGQGANRDHIVTIHSFIRF